MMLLRMTQALLVAATVSAVMLARRRPDHRLFAAFLCAVVIATVIRDRLAAVFPLLRPLDAPPFEDAARLAFHADQALFLVWPAGLAATAIVLFAQHRWLAVLVLFAWVGLVAYLVTHYPEVRGEALRRVYLGAELAALAVSAATIITTITRGWRKEHPTPARVCTLIVALVDGGLLIGGAQRWGFWERWDLQQASYSLLYATLTAFQVLTWRISPASTSR